MGLTSGLSSTSCWYVTELLKVWPTSATTPSLNRRTGHTVSDRSPLILCQLLACLLQGREWQVARRQQVQEEGQAWHMQLASWGR